MPVIKHNNRYWLLCTVLLVAIVLGGSGSATAMPEAQQYQEFGRILIRHYDPWDGGPSLTLENINPSARATISFKPNGIDGGSMYVNKNNDMAIAAKGNLIIFRVGSTGDDKMKIGADGIVEIDTLSIKGGSDIAEGFEVQSNDNIKPGMVLAIDPENPGHLQVSRQAYDRRVAGVVSGAGGVQPGMLMGQEGTLTNGRFPVAIIGRVYCWVDASYGAIEPGDLLTTSDTPGHAMKVNDYINAQGSIIGKAMTGLEQGKGLVLVLVTLQ